MDKAEEKKSELKDLLTKVSRSRGFDRAKLSQRIPELVEEIRQAEAGETADSEESEPGSGG